MKSIWVIVISALAASATSVAKADMSCSPLSGDACAVTTAAPAACADPVGIVDVGLLYVPESWVVFSEALGSVESPPEPGRGTVIDMPASPGSAALFLWGLGGFGATMLRRPAGGLHLGQAPSWFHVGGPDRIGHACRINLDPCELPICRFDEPADLPLLCRFIKLLPGFWAKPAYRLACADVRGPPRLA